MAERNFFYERLTWPQIRDAARDDKVIIIPFASIEQHGFHVEALKRQACAGSS